MISVAEALERVGQAIERAFPCELPAENIPFQTAAGFVLAKSIYSTVDSPPHDKSLVDGYAIPAWDQWDDGATFQVVEQVTAGQVPTLNIGPGQATRIMTGAPIPVGAAAVVMVERTAAADGSESSPQQVRILETPRPGQNIMRRGESMRLGDVVLQPGHVLRPVELGLLAELGVTEVPTYPRPTVAIVATGDELVGWDQTPGAGQIRNSNGPMLEALALSIGALPVSMAVARDNPTELAEAIRAGLGADVLLLSGGVSAGVLDLVPGILHQAGVQEVFHRVYLKPGQPVWFGVRATAPRPCLVFGLPGNPVSSLVCFHLFAKPALRRLAGRPFAAARRETGRIRSKFRHAGHRATYYPCRIERRGRDWLLTPLAWRGSADLRTLVDAQGLLCLDPGELELSANDQVEFEWLDEPL